MLRSASHLKLLFVLLLVNMLVSKSGMSQLNLCDQIDLKNYAHPRKFGLMTGPAEIKFAYEITHQNKRYSLVLDADNRITDLYVSDTSFSILNLKVGYKYSDIQSKIIREEMIPGFGYVVELEGHWIALFFSSEIIEERKIKEDSIITCFYKTCQACVVCPEY